MERTKENIVSSFMYYMWNAWSKEECLKVFGNHMGEHFWSKWESAWNRLGGPWGATESLYADMGTEYRKKLVDRACELYNGMKRNK